VGRPPKSENIPVKVHRGFTVPPGFPENCIAEFQFDKPKIFKKFAQLLKQYLLEDIVITFGADFVEFSADGEDSVSIYLKVDCRCIDSYTCIYPISITVQCHRLADAFSSFGDRTENFTMMLEDEKTDIILRVISNNTSTGRQEFHTVKSTSVRREDISLKFPIDYRKNITQEYNIKVAFMLDGKTFKDTITSISRSRENEFKIKMERMADEEYPDGREMVTFLYDVAIDNGSRCIFSDPKKICLFVSERDEFSATYKCSLLKPFAGFYISNFSHSYKMLLSAENHSWVITELNKIDLTDETKRDEGGRPERRVVHAVTIAVRLNAIRQQ
jgi:hypothetical protein